MRARRGSFNALLITTCHSIYIQVLKRLLVRSFYKSKSFFVQLILILEELLTQTNLLVVDCRCLRVYGELTGAKIYRMSLTCKNSHTQINYKIDVFFWARILILIVWYYFRLVSTIIQRLLLKVLTLYELTNRIINFNDANHKKELKKQNQQIFRERN